MEFEQKAEEKKMSMSKNIARLAVTAGLTAALSFGGVMAPVTMAFAAEGDDTITITQNENNGATKFKAYQIFKADVVDKDGQKVASNVDWASTKRGMPFAASLRLKTRQASPIRRPRRRSPTTFLRRSWIPLLPRS